MHQQLLTVFIVFVSLSITSALRCYTGTDQQCVLIPDTKDCAGEACRCAKYRFQCTQDDGACNAREQASGTVKWAYVILGASTCDALRAAGSVYMNVQCCSTHRCNRPDSGKCSWAQARRRSMRRLTDLLSLE